MEQKNNRLIMKLNFLLMFGLNMLAFSFLAIAKLRQEYNNLLTASRPGLGPKLLVWMIY